MSIFKKLFGKKKNPVEQPIKVMQENDLEMEVSFDSEQDLKDEDYKYTHCFVFYCLNEESFNTITKEVEDHDEAHLLSLLRNQSGVLMFDFPGIPGDSKEYSEMGDINWEQKFDDWMEQIPAQFLKEEYGNIELGEDLIALLRKNKERICTNIEEHTMEYWEDNDHSKNKETYIPAMVVSFKSSKKMNLADELSENQDGMNLVLTSGGGFLKTCSYALADKVRLDQEKDLVSLTDYWDQNGDMWIVEDIKPKSVLLLHWDTDTYCDH
jgi:hypothetical protein